MSGHVLGIIGGSGLYDVENLEAVEEVHVSTPYGAPSDAVIRGRMKDSGAAVLFLPRHGRGHRHPPSAIPYRANLCALRMLGATHVLSVSAVGSMREEIATICAGLAEDVWLERVALRTSRPMAVMSIDPSIAGQIEQELRGAPAAGLQERLEKRLLEVAAKMPASARLAELLERLRTEAPARAVDLATALVSDQGGAGAPD